MLISDYEREHYADLFSDKSTPSEVLAFLMEENHLTQRDFLSLNPESRISDILSGKRKISLEQAKVFGERFKVSPVLFLY